MQPRKPSDLPEASVTSANSDDEAAPVQDFWPLEDDPLLLSEQYPDDRWNDLAYRKRKFYIFAGSLMVSFLPNILRVAISVDMNYDVVCRNMDIPAEICSQDPGVNKAMADFMSVANLVKAIPTLLMIPVMSAVAESWGYVVGITANLAALGVATALQYPLTYLVPAHWSIYRLSIVQSSMSTVGSPFVLANLMALVASQLFPEPELRPRYLGYLQTSSSLPASFGPSSGAKLSAMLGTETFFISLTGIHIVSLIGFVMVVRLPRFISSATAQEEIAAESREPTPLGQRKPKSKIELMCGYMKEQLSALRVLKFSHIRKLSVRIAPMLIVCVRIFTTDFDATSVESIYAKQHFNWDKDIIGSLITGTASIQSAWAYFGFPGLQHLISKYWPANPAGIDMVDKTFLLLGVVTQGLGFLLMTFASTSSQFISAMIISANSAVEGIVLKPTMMKFVPPSDGAALITALSVLDAAASIIFPALFAKLYSLTLTSWPTLDFQLQFWVAAALSVAMLLLVKVYPVVRLTGQEA